MSLICPGLPTSILKAATNIAAGFTLPCSSPSAPAVTRRTAPSQLMAGRSIPRARPRPSLLATESIPVEIAKKLGGEIIRLWVASVDFQEDVTVSEDLMKQVAENYRKVRNTFKYLLSNLPDFDPAQHAVKFDDLQALDKYWLLRTAELADRVRAYYDRFEFHRIYHLVNEFAVDLSTGFIDVVKDRLYTSAPNSHGRRSAQTATWRIAEALVRLVAPIMSFTADEIWSFLPAVAGPTGKRASGALSQSRRHHWACHDPARREAVWKDFETLMKVRDAALKALEIARQEKTIGSALGSHRHHLWPRTNLCRCCNAIAMICAFC